ncbi:hypothetical protein Y032_0238g3299 [Ancylostoma ceylanicum]|uniref:Uncharacterized protein n=1 Tax=Ancylostoma ceylanicum TaxID=53326 RepID=A0A016SF60_9BILA|nr:hypothetical protein Y032_0238g3299 [Ancylostoma ceylanicum]
MESWVEKPELAPHGIVFFAKQLNFGNREFNLLVLSHFISVHLPFRPRSRRRGFTLPELKWQPTSSEVEELEEQQNYGISSNRLRRVMEGPHP